MIKMEGLLWKFVLGLMTGNNGNILKPMNRSYKAKSNAQITRHKMRSEQYHVEKRVTRSQTLQNEEIQSTRGVNYIESAGEPKDHFISPFKASFSLN